MARTALSSRNVRAGRHPKQPVDPLTPVGVFWEEERSPAGGTVPVLTVLLTGAECPFTCVYCDLWRATLDGPTPLGAVPAQLRAARRRAGPVPRGAAVKLYNHSNFFDPRAVPPADDAQIAELVAPFARVTVECHPNLIGDRCLQFAGRLKGELEVAIGLETAYRPALERLHKRMTLEDVDRAMRLLRANEIGVRVFLLVFPPFVPRDRAVESVVRSAEYAFLCGAQHVALIPLRIGAGRMADLASAGEVVPPRLSDLEEALERCLALAGGVVTADLWDAERLARCRDCGPARVARLARISRSGCIEPRVACAQCDAE